MKAKTTAESQRIAIAEAELDDILSECEEVNGADGTLWHATATQRAWAFLRAIGQL